ncbi:MAG: CoA transferase, partial [Gammaproteobacteria bacterium]|nr:CoA transferase [Gammaproteobacteria bacterium]
MFDDVRSTSAPFTGVRVVEFGQFVAVPFAAQLLAEGGANVIKIEALEGDPTRLLRPLAPGETRTFLSRNRGKHSLPLNLREAPAKPVIDALLEWADVVLMNFRPGLAEQLGLDSAVLAKGFP